MGFFIYLNFSDDRLLQQPAD